MHIRKWRQTHLTPSAHTLMAKLWTDLIQCVGNSALLSTICVAGLDSYEKNILSVDRSLCAACCGYYTLKSNFCSSHSSHSFPTSIIAH